MVLTWVWTNDFLLMIPLISSLKNTFACLLFGLWLSLVKISKGRKHFNCFLNHIWASRVCHLQVVIAYLIFSGEMVINNKEHLSDTKKDDAVSQKLGVFQKISFGRCGIRWQERWIWMTLHKNRFFLFRRFSVFLFVCLPFTFFICLFFRLVFLSFLFFLLTFCMVNVIDILSHHYFNIYTFLLPVFWLSALNVRQKIALFHFLKLRSTISAHGSIKKQQRWGLCVSSSFQSKCFETFSKLTRTASFQTLAATSLPNKKRSSVRGSIQ